MNCVNTVKSSDGVILIDKPQGPTSHDVVDFIRKEFGIRKAGHAGTLDPMATGLLIILLGSFTKKSAAFSNFDKAYEARLRLGISTDTADAEGTVTAKRDLNRFVGGADNIKDVFASFLGRIKQVPPMYSAKKIKGKKLYQLAREGKILKREPKEVTISAIEAVRTDLPYVDFFVKCSKGTYIRQLAHDIGEKIGCGAHLVFLRRTKIGQFDVEKAVPFGNLVSGKNESGEKNLKPDRADKVFYENILQPQ